MVSGGGHVAWELVCTKERGCVVARTWAVEAGAHQGKGGKVWLGWGTSPAMGANKEHVGFPSGHSFPRLDKHNVNLTVVTLATEDLYFSLFGGLNVGFVWPHVGPSSWQPVSGTAGPGTPLVKRSSMNCPFLSWVGCQDALPLQTYP